MKKAIKETLVEKTKNMHKEKELTFEAISVSKIRSLSSVDKYCTHKSRVHRGRQSSEYYVAIIDGRQAYIRISNHWGVFHTTEGIGDEKYYSYHNWELTNGIRRKDGEYANVSQAGVIWID